MKILVTGANGFVGQNLIKALKQRDVHVVCVGRQLTAPNANAFFAVPDFTEQTAWQKPLKGCDLVIHLAARVHVMNDKALNPLEEFRMVNVDGTLALAVQAAKAGAKRFLYISSIKVNGEFTELDKPFTAQDAANPQDAYAVSKYEAEQGLLLIARQTGMDVVVIRPPLIYGAGVKANFASMLKAVKRKIPLPLGAIHNKRSFVYVGNLVSLIVCCMDHPAAKNQVFLVSDDHDLSTTELLQECAAALHVQSRLWPVPQSLIKGCATLLGKQSVAQRLCGNLQVDISKTYALLGWKPPVTVADGLKFTALALQGE